MANIVAIRDDMLFTLTIGHPGMSTRRVSASPGKGLPSAEKPHI